MSADGKTAYVTSEVANAVHVFDLVAKSVAVVKTGKRPRRFAFNADGSELWVTNGIGRKRQHHRHRCPQGQRHHRL